jgi:hypothetical protein
MIPWRVALWPSMPWVEIESNAYIRTGEIKCFESMVAFVILMEMI